MASKKIYILDGPSREALFDSLRLFAEGRKFEVTTVDDKKLHISPTGGLRPANDSGLVWAGSGICEIGEVDFVIHTQHRTDSTLTRKK